VIEKREQTGSDRRRGRRRWRELRKRFWGLQVLFYPLVGGLVQLWWWSLRVTTRADRRGPLFEFLQNRKPCILAIWHQDLILSFVVMFQYFHHAPRLPTRVLVNRKALGKFAEYLLGMFGIEAIALVRRQRGEKAVDEFAQPAGTEPCNLILTCDGSRGPAYSARMGAIYTARATGLPIVGVRTWGDRLWVLERTWMRFVVPKLRGRMLLLSSAPLYVPTNAEGAQLEEYRSELERRMNAMVAAGEAYFRDGPEAANTWGPSIEPIR
jgi:lysophospholipid acyltransferase (LPLAT)-like uncharacterized protein